MRAPIDIFTPLASHTVFFFSLHTDRKARRAAGREAGRVRWRLDALGFARLLQETRKHAISAGRKRHAAPRKRGGVAGARWGAGCVYIASTSLKRHAAPRCL